MACRPGAAEALLGELDGAIRIVDAPAQRVMRTLTGHDQGILSMDITK